MRFPFAGEATDNSSEAAVDAITKLRETYVPQAFGPDSGVLVGGDTATVKDFFDISAQYTPIIILLVLGLSFILLTVVFRSIVVPAKAIVMNLLSVGAAYGLIVLIFQKGGPSFAHSIANALNFIQVDAIEAWLPLFLFSILFGLSMDYQVFLISRIREEYDKSGDNSEAVAFGLRTTAGSSPAPRSSWWPCSPPSRAGGSSGSSRWASASRSRSSSTRRSCDRSWSRRR